MTRKDYVKLAKAIRLARDMPVLILPGQSPEDTVQEVLQGLSYVRQYLRSRQFTV